MNTYHRHDPQKCVCGNIALLRKIGSKWQLKCLAFNPCENQSQLFKTQRDAIRDWNAMIDKYEK